MLMKPKSVLYFISKPERQRHILVPETYHPTTTVLVQISQETFVTFDPLSLLSASLLYTFE